MTLEVGRSALHPPPRQGRDDDHTWTEWDGRGRAVRRRLPHLELPHCGTRRRCCATRRSGRRRCAGWRPSGPGWWRPPTGCRLRDTARRPRAAVRRRGARVARRPGDRPPQRRLDPRRGDPHRACPGGAPGAPLAAALLRRAGVRRAQHLAHLRRLVGPQPPSSIRPGAHARARGRGPRGGPDRSCSGPGCSPRRGISATAASSSRWRPWPTPTTRPRTPPRRDLCAQTVSGDVAHGKGRTRRRLGSPRNRRASTCRCSNGCHR